MIKTLREFKLVNMVIGLIILMILLIGCADDTSGDQSFETELEKEAFNIEIDTNELEINVTGIELLEIEVEDYLIIAFIKNNSDNDYDHIRVEMKLYDEEGTLLSTKGTYEPKIDAGEVWKARIPHYLNNEISKIKVTEILVRDYSENSTESKDTIENQAEVKLKNSIIGSAKTLISNNIKSPATAQWVSSEIIDRDNYGRYLVDVVLDAENGYGALIRGGFIVALQSVKEDGTFTYSPMLFMKEYNKEFEKERAIGTVKSMNNWNQDRKKEEKEKDLKTEDSKVEEIHSLQEQFLREDEMYDILMEMDEVRSIDVHEITFDIITYPTIENPIYEIKLYEDFEDHTATLNYFTLDGVTGELISIMFD